MAHPQALGAVLGGAAVVLTAVVLTRSPEGAAVVDPSVEVDGPTAGALESAEGDRIVV